jgi:uncharacterized protein
LGTIVKVVIDVNVWVSGPLWGGLPAKVLRLAQQETIESCISAELLLELETTLRKSKLQPQLVKRQQTVEYLCDVVREISTVIEIDTVQIPQLRDPNDVKILATALEAEAQCE